MYDLIELVVLILVFGIAYWVSTRFALPKPIRIAVDVAFALIAIAILLAFVGWGPVPWHWHHRSGW